MTEQSKLRQKGVTGDPLSSGCTQISGKHQISEQGCWAAFFLTVWEINSWGERRACADDWSERQRLRATDTGEVGAGT